MTHPVTNQLHSKQERLVQTLRSLPVHLVHLRPGVIQDLLTAAYIVEQASASKVKQGIAAYNRELGRFQRKPKAVPPAPTPSVPSVPPGPSPDQTLEGRTREWADSLIINSPEDILALPWAGNHAWDCQLFNRCERYTLGLTDREQQKRALTNMCHAGMGISTPTTDAELDDWLEFIKE